MAISDIAIRISTKGAQLAQAQMGKLSGVASKLGGVATKVGKAFAVALAVGIAKATKEFIEFDDAMGQSLAIMQTNIDQQDRMQKKARQVALTTRISAKDSAEAYFFLASAGLDAEQSISALPQVAKFAQAGMFDMALATDLATDSQSALGLTVSDAQQNLQNLTRVTDVLVKANTLANASVQQFSEALTNKAGASLKVANKSIEEGVAVLSAFADRGVKGAEAGDKLNQLLRDIPRATAKNGDEFRKLNLQMFDSQGNMKNVADLIEELDRVLQPMSDELKASTLDQLGLNRGVADAVKILSGASAEIRTYQSALEDAGGMTQSVADNQIQSLKGELILMKDKWVELGLMLIEEFEPTLRRITKGLDGVASGFIALMKDTEDLTQAEKEQVDQMRIMTLVMAGLNGVEATRIVEAQRHTEKIREQGKNYAHNTAIINNHIEAMKDQQRNAHRYEVEMAMVNDRVEENTDVTEENTDAQKEAQKIRDNALKGLQAVLDAEQNLKDIYQEQRDALKEVTELTTDRDKANDDLSKAETNLEKAIEHKNKVAGEGLKQTNEELLAIARQEERVKSLTELEDKSEIQKLELKVAQERLNELRADAIALSNEEIRAEQDVKRAEEDLQRAKDNLEKSQKKLNKASDEYNDLMAKTPANLLRVAIAKKELDDAIANVKDMKLFKEGLEQMVEFAGGQFNILARQFQAIFNTSGKSATADMFSDATSGGGNNNAGGSPQQTFDPLGQATTNNKAKKSIMSVGDFNMGKGITNNNNVVVNVGCDLSSADDISVEVANAMIRAQKMGIKVLI